LDVPPITQAAMPPIAIPATAPPMALLTRWFCRNSWNFGMDARPMTKPAARPDSVSRVNAISFMGLIVTQGSDSPKTVPRPQGPGRNPAPRTLPARAKYWGGSSVFPKNS